MRRWSPNKNEETDIQVYINELICNIFRRLPLGGDYDLFVTPERHGSWACRLGVLKLSKRNHRIRNPSNEMEQGGLLLQCIIQIGSLVVREVGI